MSDTNGVMVDTQLTTVCLMITVCTDIVISCFDLCAETAGQFSSVDSWVVSVDELLRETNIFAGCSLYVISSSCRISESNTLPTVVLAQGVRDFDFVQNI